MVGFSEKKRYIFVLISEGLQFFNWLGSENYGSLFFFLTENYMFAHGAVTFLDIRMLIRSNYRGGRTIICVVIYPKYTNKIFCNLGKYC